MKISNIQQLQQIEANVVQYAQRAMCDLTQLPSGGMAQFQAMKFDPIGFHPISGKPLNLIEQVNQTFTVLVTCQAIRKLYELHGTDHSYTVNLGTEGGTDIVSTNGEIVAEVFAAVNPTNNKKLSKDMSKACTENPNAEHRYVFFYAPNHPAGRKEDLEKRDLPVQVWAVDLKSTYANL